MIATVRWHIGDLLMPLAQTTTCRGSILVKRNWRWYVEAVSKFQRYIEHCVVRHFLGMEALQIFHRGANTDCMITLDCESS